MLTFILIALASQQTADFLHDAEQRAFHSDLKSSETLLRRALVSIEEGDPDPKPAKAMVLRNLAGVLRRQGRHADALQAARQSLALVESRFGSEDILLVPVLNTLAEIQIERGYFNAAHHHLLRAAALGPDSGAHYATTLFDLGALHSKLGDGKRASQYYRQAYELRVRLLGRTHPHTLFAESALVRLARK